jgi:hypothetical protein
MQLANGIDDTFVSSVRDRIPRFDRFLGPAGSRLASPLQSEITLAWRYEFRQPRKDHHLEAR